MSNIKAMDVAKLRKQTGAGMMDCKTALVEANGDFNDAIDVLRKKGQKVAAKRAELEEQKRNLLQQQVQVRDLEMEEIVDQGQIESFCDLKVGDDLVGKMQVSVLVRDGIVEAIEQG